MSSCCRLCSAPKRLGQGMILRTITSTRPRKATTAKNVTRIDHPRPQPSAWYKSRKNAGAVTSAMSVAARVSQRHCPASESFRCRKAGGIGRRSSAKLMRAYPSRASAVRSGMRAYARTVIPPPGGRYAAD